MATKTIDEVLAALSPRNRELAQRARSLLRAALPGIAEEVDPRARLIGYGFGRGNKHLVCVLILTDAGVRIGFQNSNALPDPAGLLQNAANSHGYVGVVSDAQIAAPALHDLLAAALLAYRARNGVAPQSGISFDELCLAAAGLPGVASSTSYGTPALKVAGKLMLRLIDDGAAAALKCNWDERERLMAASPDVFYVTAHYQAYPWVLIRLARLDPAAAPALLDMAWRLVASNQLRKRRDLGK